MGVTYVWVGKATIDPKEKTVVLEPIRLEDLKKWKETPSDAWKNLEKLLHEEEPFELNVRLGGGVVPAIINPSNSNDYSFLLLERDEKAPRAPLSLDIPSGIDDATFYETQKSPESPRIPIIVRLFSEGYEIIPVSYENGVPIYHVHYPRNLEKSYQSYMQSTGINTAALLAKRGEKAYSIWVRESGEIGKFKNGWKIVEESKEYKLTIDGAQITFEPSEKSLEMIIPYVFSCSAQNLADTSIGGLKVKGDEKVFLDGEHFGEIDLHDIGLILDKLKPLDRYILSLYPDGRVRGVYKGGEIVERNVDFSEYANKIGLPIAIKSGKTTGMTSKVEQMYKEGKRGNKIVTEEFGEFTLDAFVRIGNYLTSFYQIKS